MINNFENTFYPSTQKEWREWLIVNHEIKNNIWIIFYKKNAQTPSLEWSNAVDEALCFGWIDSKRKSLDNDRFIQFFSKRKAKSTWSKINKLKIIELTKQGLMYPLGNKAIELAKLNGSWTILDEVEEGILPSDFEQAMCFHEGAKEKFRAMSKSVQRNYLLRLVLLKRPESRQKLIGEILLALVKVKLP